MADKCPAGAPMWMVTFADLMALLLVLFVLLLTFAEMDVVKFKAMAGSMRDAFGVSREDKLAGIIEFEGALRRKSASDVDPTRAPQPAESSQTVSIELPEASDQEIKEEAERRQDRRLEEISGAMQEVIDKEVAGSGITVKREGNKVIVLFPSEIAFPSGSGRLTHEFSKTLGKLLPVLSKTKGDIIVSGHTDNVPMSGGEYQSNWELSSARATAVVHRILKDKQFDSKRITIQGHGDSKPLAPNNTPQNRAKNRRVEISVLVEK